MGQGLALGNHKKSLLDLNSPKDVAFLPSTLTSCPNTVLLSGLRPFLKEAKKLGVSNCQ